MAKAKLTDGIMCTDNYRLFRSSIDNRDLNLPEHKKLEKSMKLYGFLRSCPIIVRRDKSGILIVVDGQHRLAFAERLGLSVWYVEETVDFDIADLNGTVKPWKFRDYVQNYAKRGYKQYEELLQFAALHQIPLQVATCLLGGTLTFSNIQLAFRRGDFRIKERSRAEMVVKIYAAFKAVCDSLTSVRLIEAIVAASRIEGFDPSRLTDNLANCRDKLHSYSTRDGFLEMLEDIYNFRKKTVVPLKFNAIQAMRKRNPIHQEDDQ